jgi:hypothetical protein
MQGYVVNSANLLQDAFYRIFQVPLSLERDEAAASGGTNRFHDHASAIWNVVLADSLQRDMAMAAISSVPTTLKLAGAIRRLKWASTAAIKLANYRNILAHNPIVFVHTIADEPHPPDAGCWCSRTAATVCEFELVQHAIRSWKRAQTLDSKQRPEIRP